MCFYNDGDDECDGKRDRCYISKMTICRKTLASVCVFHTSNQVGHDNHHGDDHDGDHDDDHDDDVDDHDVDDHADSHDDDACYSQAGCDEPPRTA